MSENTGAFPAASLLITAGAGTVLWPSQLPRLLLGWLVFWFCYQLLVALYNISPLHPLSHIPGPRLAAATYLPEFYYDVCLFGRYTMRIRAMHEQYGPLVRISPNEVHCNDPAFSDEIYAIGSRKRDKSAHQVNGTVLNIAEFGTADHDLHKIRRAPVAKFFSRSNVAQLEGEIKEYVQALCDKLLRQKPQDPFDFKTAYSCFTADVVSSYAFGQSFGFLAQDGWYPNFREPTESALQTTHFLRWWPFLKSLDKLATYLVDYLPEDVALFVRTMQIELPAQVDKTREAFEAGLLSVKDRRTIFAEIFVDESMISKEKSTYRLAVEGFAVVGAGTETTASALAVITYHLLNNSGQMAKLVAELEEFGVANNPRELPSYAELEKLPYLTAVIKEGLRLSYGVSSRTARIAPEEDLIYRGEWNKKEIEYVVPRGYAVGMSTAVTHHHEDFFPNSHKFLPERWLDEQDQLRKEPEKAFMPFSKGSRRCLASILALCEIHFTVAALAIRVWPHMHLFDTTDVDVEYHHDMFIPMPHKSSRGFRATIS